MSCVPFKLLSKDGMSLEVKINKCQVVRMREQRPENVRNVRYISEPLNSFST